MKKFSVVIPVYNRPNEVLELMESLKVQTNKNFEVIFVEDGSTEKSDEVIAQFPEIQSSYFFKKNSGPGDSRNFGMTKAKGEYILFFDSDCVIPKQYFQVLEDNLNKDSLDAFGGPDNAAKGFTNIQKAINYAMTSIFTTGGVRGKKSKMDNFQPRSFNMGIKQSVFHKVGGFSDIHPGEDPDLSYRIMDAGFKVGLIEEAYVYHKRRIDFAKFIKQVYKFGTVRPILMKWYPKRTKLVYFFPSIFLLGSVFLLLFSILVHPIFIAPLGFLTILLFVDALRQSKSLKIAILAVVASFIQLYSYAFGFVKSYINIHLLKLDERKVYSDFFFFK